MGASVLLTGVLGWFPLHAGATNRTDGSASPSPAPTSLTTTLSGGGASGTIISVPENTAVTDSATLSGTNASNATGTVAYRVYSDSACTKLVWPTLSNHDESRESVQSIVTPGTVPDSTPVSFSEPGTYYWQATYSGDADNQSSTTKCGTVTEQVVAPANNAAQGSSTANPAASGGPATADPASTPAPTTSGNQSGNGTTHANVAPTPSSPTATSLNARLSGGGQSGSTVSVAPHTAVTDSATLSGPNAAHATGAVTYSVYSNAGCTAVAAPGAPEAITTPGSLPPSNPVSLGTAGTYYWRASYSGDAANQSSTSPCGAVIERVLASTGGHDGAGQGHTTDSATSPGPTSTTHPDGDHTKTKTTGGKSTGPSGKTGSGGKKPGNNATNSSASANALVSPAVDPANAIVSDITDFTPTDFGPNDDGTYPCTSSDIGTPPDCTGVAQALGFPINFFGTEYTAVYINNNGNLTFDSPLSAFSPFSLENQGHVIIAPFFADVDTRAGNTVNFGTGTLDGHKVFVVNWPASAVLRKRQRHRRLPGDPYRSGRPGHEYTGRRLRHRVQLRLDPMGCRGG